MKSNTPVRGLLARAPLAAAVAVALLAAAPVAQAFEFQKGGLTGSLDTTVSYGFSWRLEDQDPDLIGKALFDPPLCFQNVPLAAIPPGPGRCTSTGGVPGSPAQIAARGRFSVNRDDGNLKYDDGDLFSNAVKVTIELGLNWRDWGAFVRATYFYDFENDRPRRPDRRRAGQGRQPLPLLDAFLFHELRRSARRQRHRCASAARW